MKSVCLGVVAMLLAGSTARAVPTIFVCGDSTAKFSGSETMEHLQERHGQPMAGWGTPLVEFFEPAKVTVRNVAHAGTSSRTYYDGDWPRVLPQIREGDFVLLVFGINDGGLATPDGIGDEVIERPVVRRGGRRREAEASETSAQAPDMERVHTYGWYMGTMATDAAGKGASVTLLTPTPRNIWTNPKVRFRDATPVGSDNQPLATLPADYDPKDDRIERGTGNGRYGRWTQEVAAKFGLPVFDLTNFCAGEYEKLGRERVNEWYLDHNHTFLPGARFVARSVVAGLKAMPDSPFIPLLSDAGREVVAADLAMVRDHRPAVTAMPASGGIERGQIPDQDDGMVAGIPVNYTEAKAHDYVLPDVLRMFDGTPVEDATAWRDWRRPELLEYYQREVYGRIPATAPTVRWEVVSTDAAALDGTAVKKVLAGRMGPGPEAPAIEATLTTPADATGPVPVLVALTFNGPRRRAAADPAHVPPAVLLARGYGYATINYASIETDQSGRDSPPNITLVRRLALRPGQTAMDPDDWGTIAAWAWGISRVIDYLETDPDVDATRVGITGTSRLGKTVTWAGANDDRIALVIACCGGEGGAALARRTYGETIAHLVEPTRYPYQFAGNYAKYAADPATSLVDSHCLVALMAPRPILLSTGLTDAWSDPHGEFLAAVAATPVFELLGMKGIDRPAYTAGCGEMVGGALSYLMVNGGHGATDWDRWIAFMDAHLRPTK